MVLCQSLPMLMSQEVLRHLAVPSRASFDKAAEEAEDRRLAAAANFSDEQKRVLVALRAALYTNLGRLQRRREKLTAELQVSLTSACSRVTAKSQPECYSTPLQPLCSWHSTSSPHMLVAVHCNARQQPAPRSRPCSRCCQLPAVQVAKRGIWLGEQQRLAALMSRSWTAWSCWL